MAIKKSFRLISYSNEIADGEPIYISSNCLPVKAINKEPAGHAFHEAALKLMGFYEEEDTDSDDQNASDSKGMDYRASSDSYSNKGKKKSAAGATQDHYALLGLGHLRFLATEEQIRKSYRETALKYHPDKQATLLLAEESEAAKQAKKDEIEAHFKSIQEAYEVLMDPLRRRIYDSTDEFDDEVPTECAPQDFFKVFGPVFMRNARWSVNQQIPLLGDDNTPLKEVDNFYDFWYSFKSWREFPHADEFELDQAESRDHKRWMERQNAKLSERSRKLEYARIRTLVDNAYKKDPRILRRKEDEKAEKQRKKEAKALARKQQEEEAARAAEEERRRKEDEDRRAAETALSQKKVKEKEKKLMRKERTRLRALSSSLVSANILGLTEDHVDSLCKSLEIDQLRELCDEAERKEGIERAQLLRNALGSKTSSYGTQLHEKNSEQNGSHVPTRNGVVVPSKPANLFENYERKEKTWGREEIELLRKGMQKYPKGTSRRWEVISEFIGTGRSVEDILKATKTVLLQKPDSSKAFDTFLEKRKPAPTIASPLSTRVESQGTPLVPTDGLAKTNSSKTDNASNSSGSEGAQLSSESGATANGTSSTVDQDVWSAVQERALVQALKTFPKETTQRWERVAAAVPGKTVNQCKKKFALMKENFRSKKNAD
ncbi:hypothetical protein Sjap_002025 [Stephania japonica]|uniref:Uncharacterized protein n=1 Tax=Stephania japonica TaxID=461633 RepID=A0AAP0KNN4_9MAGN